MTIETKSNFTLKRGEVEAFPISVSSDKDIEVTLGFSGIPGGTCLFCEGRDYLGKK